MLYFPQLSTGALCQYPISKQRRLRTIANLAADGRIFKAPDYGVSEIQWELHYTGLDDTELAALESLFEATEGRLHTFTILDPTDNLLRWSDDLSTSVWTRGPMLLIAPTNDPLGTMRANRVVNGGAAEQSFEQTVAAPAWFHHCFSVYAKTTSPQSIVLYRNAGAQTDFASVHVGATWERLALSGKFTSSEETVTFGVRLPAGASVDVYGLQTEPQVSPSGYKATTTRSGVYDTARFGEDTLRVVTRHLNQHTAVVRILVVEEN